MTGSRISRRGNAAHRVYSVVVFVLASLDNVAIGLVPPLYAPIAGVARRSARRASAWSPRSSFLVSAVAAVGWAYVGRPAPTASRC